MVQILVVEDDENLNKIICSFLKRKGFVCEGCQHPIEAYQLLYTSSFDLIVSDIMMPEVDGLTFVRKIRKENPYIPIILVTALEDFSSKQKGFIFGVDDYMVKPIDLEEMVLRITALLRRSQIQIENKIEIGEVILLRDEMTIYVKGVEKKVTPREFSILYKMLCSPKKIFTRSELTDDYLGITSDSNLRTVDVYITRLRKEFSDCTSFEILTVHGFGYKVVLK